MAQRSISSYFTTSATKAVESSSNNNESTEDTKINISPNSDNNEDKTSNVLKRRRIITSDSDSSKEEVIETKVLKVETPINDSIIKPMNYDPTKKPYDIVSDACWKTNEKIPYLALAKTFSAVESISQRLEITRVLSNLLRSVIYLNIEDLIPTIYLCLNKVAPDYEGVELGIGESVIIDSLVQAMDTSKNSIKALMKIEGDLGNIANNLKSSQQFLISPKPLSVATVFNKLKEIANISGKTVQKKKVEIIKNMLNSSVDCERKFIVRGLMGKLRLGLAEQTLLASLGQALTLTPVDKQCPRKINDIDILKPQIDNTTAILKNAFCECPNYDLIINTIIKNGLTKLPEYCSITPGIPIKPMLAHPSKGVSEIFARLDDLEFTCEYKYDGERAQIHVKRDTKDKIQVQIFSRNQENNTSKYPDIVRLVSEVIGNSDIKSCIIDSEAVAWDRKNNSILPFQVLSTRKRKDVDEKDITIQVCIYAFDLLYFNGQSLVRNSLRERRNVLREHFPEIAGKFTTATFLDTTDSDEISVFLETSINDKCEGLMIKTLDVNSTYEISKRSHNWLKLKKDYLDNVGDSLDLVVIGASYGNGKRANKYGNFMMACYDPLTEHFQSVCKLGTGLSDELLDEMYKILKEISTPKPKPFYELDSSCKMDVWFEPHFVWEIKAADFSLSPLYKAAYGEENDKGISLRFPRFIKVRDDKRPEDATTSKQISEMYRSQAQIKTNIDDDENY